MLRYEKAPPLELLEEEEIRRKIKSVLHCVFNLRAVLNDISPKMCHNVTGINDALHDDK